MDDEYIRNNSAHLYADTGRDQQSVDLPSAEASQQLLEGTLHHLNLRDRMYRPNIQQAGSREARVQ